MYGCAVTRLDFPELALAASPIRTDAPRFSSQSWTAGYFRCNFIEIHRRLRMSPAMAAGGTARLWSVEDLVTLWECHRLLYASDTFILNQ
jgi:hypothetical protein